MGAAFALVSGPGIGAARPPDSRMVASRPGDVPVLAAETSDYSTPGLRHQVGYSRSGTRHALPSRQAVVTFMVPLSAYVAG